MISVQVDTRDAARYLDDVAKRQLPFAIMRGINKTLDDAQAAIRDHLNRAFIFRTGASRKFAERTILIRKEDRATKDNPSGTIRVDANRGKWDMLSKFEAGGPRVAGNPTFPFAIPTSAIRPSFGDSVPRSLYPKNLGLVPRRSIKGAFEYHAKGRSRKAGVHTTASGVVQLKGKNRTFVIGAPGSRDWGVFRRVGPGRGDVRLIWAFRTRITLEPILEFEATARQTVAERWKANFDDALAYALATAR